MYHQANNSTTIITWLLPINPMKKRARLTMVIPMTKNNQYLIINIITMESNMCNKLILHMKYLMVLEIFRKETLNGQTKPR